VQFGQLVSQESWCPAINAYRCYGQIKVCVDLAGVDRSAIELRVETRRLTIRGHRQAPEPSEPKALQVLAMEIDYGPFERQIELPADVEARQVSAVQGNGLLWIHLPLLPES
jgi:HSP20 family protein